MVVPEPSLCPLTSIISSEPPPRSPTTPSGFQIPEITPRADSLASRLPEISSTGWPDTCSQRARNSAPFAASRAAAVARTRISRICMASHSTRNRASVHSALSMASVGSRPVLTTLRPSPHSTFSLKIGVGARTSPS